MIIANLILAHKNPVQLKRLVTRLSSDNTYIYIHLDNKTPNVLDYFQIANEVKNTFFIAQRTTINWGAYSMIQATLSSLNQIINQGIQFDYLVLLSGQDYPIKSNREIFNFFENHRGLEFINYSPFPTKELPNGGMDRIEYFYDLDNFLTSLQSGNYTIFESEMRRKGIKRKFIDGMKPYHGSQWWNLSRSCVKYVLEAVRNDTEIVSFYKYSKFQDEHFFQTLIMNSEFSKYVVNDNLRLIDWSHIDLNNIDWVNDPPHPFTFTINDFPRLARTSALFARKFNIEIDSQILDMIDEKLL